MNGREKNALKFLGMAMRAGKVVTGEEMVIQTVRAGRAYLLLIANDASERTIKKITDKCKTYGVDWTFFGLSETLGHAVGKERRVVIAITDKGFAAHIKRKIEAENHGGD